MELFHRTYGNPDHPVLCILHGLFGSSDNWVSFGRQFAADGFFVCIPDLRNHGRSGRSNLHGYEAMSDDLLELMDALSVPSAHLLGHSMGGKLAMQFSFDHPERVEKLVVADISPAASHQTHHQGLINLLLSIDLSMHSSRHTVEALLAERIGKPRLAAFLMKNLYWKDRSTLGWRVELEVIKENLSEIFRPVTPPVPSQRKALFIRGGDSPYVPDGDMQLIRQIFPKATVETIPGATHWLHADKPAEFGQAVRRFLVG